MNAIEHWDRPLDSAETQRAIEAILARVERIDEVCGEGFPLYHDGAWKVSAGGSWLGGFWAGLWWLRAVHYGRTVDRQAALRIAGRLRDKLDTDTHHRSLIFWYGAGLGAQLLADPQAAALAHEAAQRLARAFDPVLGCIPLGREMGGGARGDRLLSIDPLAATLNLFAQGNDPGLLSLGRQHLQTSFRGCAGAAGAWSSHALCEQGQWHAADRAGDWSRGQAWAMLGLGGGARLYGVPFREDAQQASQYWLRSRPVGAPLNRLAEPGGPSDPCAAAMASLALQAQALDQADGHVLQQEAGRLLAAVVRSGDFVDGRFSGHCYRTSAATEQKVESACGSFFLLAALMAWAAEIDPRVV